MDVSLHPPLPQVFLDLCTTGKYKREIKIKKKKLGPLVSLIYEKPYLVFELLFYALVKEYEGKDKKYYNYKTFSALVARQQLISKELSTMLYVIGRLANY